MTTARIEVVQASSISEDVLVEVVSACTSCITVVGREIICSFRPENLLQPANTWH